MWRIIPLAVFQSLLLTGGQVFLKFALMRMAPFGWNRAFWSSVFVNWQFAVCGLLFLAASLLWIYIVKAFPFSMAYPLVSLSYVFGMLAAILIFREEVPLTRWLGVLLIMAGCMLMPAGAKAQGGQTVRQQVAAATKGMKTMRCDFVQTRYTSLLAGASVSRGTLSYRSPDRLCWEYTSPTAHTFLIDGQKVVTTDSCGSREVDMRHHRMYREMARLMTGIMSGQSLAGDQDFEVAMAPADGKKTEWTATLIPRRKEVRRMFSTIILRITADRWLVRQVELVEAKGDRTVIELKNIQVGH